MVKDSRCLRRCCREKLPMQAWLFRLAPERQSECVGGAWAGDSIAAQACEGCTCWRRRLAAIRTLYFVLAMSPVNVTIQNWSGFIGQWDNRQWKQTRSATPAAHAAAGHSTRHRSIASEIANEI